MIGRLLFLWCVHILVKNMSKLEGRTFRLSVCICGKIGFNTTLILSDF